MPCFSVPCSVVSVPANEPLARLSVSRPVLRFGMTAPVRFARAFAIAAVPLFDRLVMSLLSAVAVFLPEVMIDVVSWSKALMRCCWNVSCLRASLI